MKKTDIPVANINSTGNSKVEVHIFNINMPSAKDISLYILIGVIVLAVLLCCPEAFADFVRLLISLVFGS